MFYAKVYDCFLLYQRRVIIEPALNRDVLRFKRSCLVSGAEEGLNADVSLQSQRWSAYTPARSRKDCVIPGRRQQRGASARARCCPQLKMAPGRHGWTPFRRWTLRRRGSWGWLEKHPLGRHANSAGKGLCKRWTNVKMATVTFSIKLVPEEKMQNAECPAACAVWCACYFLWPSTALRGTGD